MKRIIILTIALLWVTAASAQYTAVRVNGLGLLTGTLNVGADVRIGPRWSVDGAAYWNPIKTESLRIQTAAFSVGARYWRYEPHVGPFFGIQNTTAFYNFGGKTYHKKGWMSGIGVSYGYSRLLSNRWNLSAELGLGVYYMNDTRRRNIIDDNEDIYIYHYRRIIFAPTRAEISISYLF